MLITSLKNCPPTFTFSPVSFFPLFFFFFFFCISTENRIKLRIILNLNHKLTWSTMEIMLIQTFVLKVINTERKILTHHEIIDRIAKQIVSMITQVWKNQNCWFKRTYGDLVFHLLIHLSLLIFVLQIYGP